MTALRLALTFGLALLVTACTQTEESPSAVTRRSSIKEWSKAPQFSVPSASGGRVSLDEFRGRKPVLLYFSMGLKGPGFHRDSVPGVPASSTGVP